RVWGVGGGRGRDAFWGPLQIPPAITYRRGLRGRHTLLAVPLGPGRAHTVGRRSGRAGGTNTARSRCLTCTTITGGRHARNVGLRRRLGVGASPAQIQRRPIDELAGDGCP